jgi:glycosyltransferase involved in cell wall biosynthesis
MIGGGRGVAKNCSHERNEATHNYEMEMYKLAKQLDIADRVTWTSGYDSDSEEASLFLHAADSCVLPYDEGVTLNRSSLGAAAAHGLPIITTRGKVMESAFVEERNVLLCPPKNPRALAIAIESLIHNPVLRQRLHEGALKLASEWFSWDKAVERTIETLNGIK